MPSIEDVLDLIKEKLVTATTGLKVGNTDIGFSIKKGWPSNITFDVQGKDPAPLCKMGIYPAEKFKRVNRYMPRTIKRVTTEPGVQAVLRDDNKVLLPGQSTTITLSVRSGQTAVKEKDAVGIPLRLGAQYQGVTVSAAANETLTTLATKLRNAINAEIFVKDWISATSSGPVVTITNLLSSALRIDANYSNVGTDTKEVGRFERQISIATWNNSIEVRKVVGRSLEAEIASWDFFGGTKVDLVGNPWWDEDVQKNLYRCDFILLVEYGVTKDETVYPVLVAKPNQEILFE